MPDLEPIKAVPTVRVAKLETVGPIRSDAEPAKTPRLAILSGPIFSRARDIIAANMNDLLDRSDDQAVTIRRIIAEMEEVLVELRASAARSIADIKELRSATDRLIRQQSLWTDRAELALAKDREDLARQALVERSKASDLIADLEGEVGQIETVLKNYERDIAKLEAKLRDARRRQAAIAQRFESAMTRARANEAIYGSRTESALSRLDDLEREADMAEARADALGMGNTLDDEFEQLKSDERVEADLKALKASLAAKKN
ncbi:PspA/IM30 family protein [Sphingomicrobium clamense]|uniref:PspA/IM30 family protein n=1 Tax=Sphingomicrobium clamense TaxID=2851013 RepID=A0ABS6V7X1_9SPHN|nr:PspA/IM30 family protein [Sphingomicrobium sp. B8]MBW0145651.1 PspA/IM30 family protein [Sphingomicrobium sp. B8]